MIIDRLSENRLLFLKRRQFYHFLEHLAKDISKSELAELEYELESITTTYDALIDYFNQGIADPERDRVYLQLAGRALQLSDRTALALHRATEMPYYTSQLKKARHESLRTYLLQLESFADGTRNITDAEQLKQLASTHDRQLSELFTELWTQGAWTAATASEADALLLSPTVTTADQSTIVSAVTLSLLRSFDPLKWLFLCDAYYHPEAMVSMRALVGIVIGSYCWYDRLPLYPEAHARLDLLREDPMFGDQVCDVLMQFTRSTDTEEVDRKMREEIIPGLMKNPKLRNMPNITLDDNGNDDINPDWEEWMHESGLEESMREITEWQMEGVDVNMSTFSQLKRYPFFFNLCNWFRPFDAWQADMLDIVGNPNATDNPIAATILQSNYLCDSDKYSFCYAIREIPQMQREVMMSQLDEQNRALKEGADIPDLKRLSRQTAQSILRQYVQNLYRFFRLFSSAKEFDNPFEILIEYPEHDNPLYATITDPDRVLRLINLHLKRKDYNRAIDFFIPYEIHHHDRMEATQLQQLGLCYQKLGYYEDAIRAYNYADLKKPNSYWTILHLAQCYEKVFEHEKALEYYEMALSMKPDNLNLTFHVAEQLEEEGRYDEALPHLHKIEYHHPGSLKTLRLMAYCYLFNEQKEQKEQKAQAIKCYDRMIAEHASEMNAIDWKFAAFSYWVLCPSRRDECFRCLGRAEELHEPYDEEYTTFADIIYRDSNLAQLIGGSQEEAFYMYDAYHRTKHKS